MRFDHVIAAFGSSQRDARLTGPKARNCGQATTLDDCPSPRELLQKHLWPVLLVQGHLQYFYGRFEGHNDSTLDKFAS